MELEYLSQLVFNVLLSVSVTNTKEIKGAYEKNIRRRLPCQNVGNWVGRHRYLPTCLIPIIIRSS